ncbi:ATP-binding protein [Pseudonocardia sp. TRM90224]|uniref:ATP-binding protein n=1 Tax=Pseudonocardia sp. TRM90224 TaxID=2812678 RepID=UPI001E306FB0|nr:LuxR C-terminal-related transcriptional regulator [Pseudonocardia sp. TRM90224]
MSDPVNALSPREAEVLAALGEHLTNAEIATKLYISIRTVESHVSSLLRKLGASDRRALAALAVQGQQSEGTTQLPVPQLPAPLSSFVGRAAERAELAAALRSSRLVTAVGPGGVGKTRLALTVAADVAADYADGARYVDLLPVTDDASVAAAVAGALGLGEQQGRSVEETIAGWVAPRWLLLVLDNTEHLADGVAMLVERLLVRSAGLTVLATSRARLMLPFERVFPVDGLSLPSDGDAVTLFVERAAIAGAVPPDRDRVARICRALDGVPLAIELAAARLPAVGIDGLEAGLAERLDLLVGSRRVDERHRSLRSTLDWSAALLDDESRTVLRRVAVFAGAFRAESAAAVVGGPPVAPEMVAVRLGQLVEQSLLVAVPAGDVMRYRMLETVRQYGLELLAEADEQVLLRDRHLRWCREAGAALLARSPVDAQWRAAFDQLADELRRALSWAKSVVDRRGDAHDAAVVLAALAHRRGMPAEAQRRSEQAAELAGSELLVSVALGRAAGSAQARLAGNDALRLHRSAAEAALRAGLPTVASVHLARVVELSHRSPGIIVTLPEPDELERTLAEASRHAGDDPVAQAWIATAIAFRYAMAEPGRFANVERALELARRSGDPLVESSALDCATTLQLTDGDVAGALASARRRLEILAPLPLDAEIGFELADALGMTTETAIATGDFETAKNTARQLVELPLHREVGHVAAQRSIVVAALVGDWDTMFVNAELFIDGWEAAGRPRIGGFRRAVRAVTTVCGMKADEAGQARWTEVLEQLRSTRHRIENECGEELFTALLHLHRNDHASATAVLSQHPHHVIGLLDGVWRPWLAALSVEAAALAGAADIAERVASARRATDGSAVAALIVDRAAAYATGDTDGIRTAGKAMLAAGCRYQWARSLVLAGDEEGPAAMAALGATT